MRNSPSSSRWVKFEDSEEVMMPTRVSNSHMCSSSIRDGRAEHRDWTKDKDRGTSQWSSSRYSVFDSLRFGGNKQSDMGWSSYLLGEGDRNMVMDT